MLSMLSAGKPADAARLLRESLKLYPAGDMANDARWMLARVLTLGSPAEAGTQVARKPVSGGTVVLARMSDKVQISQTTTDGSGGFTLHASASDSTGIDRVAFPDLTGTAGFAGSGGTVLNSAGDDPWAVDSGGYGFGATATTPPASGRAIRCAGSPSKVMAPSAMSAETAERDSPDRCATTLSSLSPASSSSTSKRSLVTLRPPQSALAPWYLCEP